MLASCQLGQIGCHKVINKAASIGVGGGGGGAEWSSDKNTYWVSKRCSYLGDTIVVGHIVDH